MATISKRAKWISGDVAVWYKYATEIGDNGESGDRRQALMVAPAVDSSEEYVYIETNGDPVLVGWIEDDELEYADDFDRDWLESETWLAEYLDDIRLYLPE